MNRRHSFGYGIGFFLLAVGAALMLFGCGGPERSAALERARDAYLQAESDPEIAQKAPVELHEAKRTIEKAEKAEEMEKKERLAYLAQRQVELARAEAERKMAEEKMESLSRENQKVLLEARSREAEEKGREVEQARREAMQLKQEAEQSAREVERTRQQALALKQEAEQQTREAEIARQQAQRAQEQARQFAQRIDDLEAEKTERGLVLTLGDVLFDSGRADLRAGAMRGIDKLAAFLMEYPNRNVLIEGHTDSVGNDSYNLTLSQQRADAVKMALVSRGIAPGRIISKGYGETFPVASNDTNPGRQQNRRVEIVILDEGVSGRSMMRY